jgi:DNA damage-binding protein 1
MKFYSVTSFKPTSVSQAIKCSFTAPGVSNLVQSKGNRMEVYTFVCNATAAQDSMDVDEDSQQYSLTMTEEIPLNGRVVSVQTIRPKDQDQDRLFILTEHKHFCVLGYDADKKKVITFACGDLSSAIGRHPESGLRCVVDPLNRMIAMVLYEGHLKLLPMQAGGGFQAAFDERILEITRLIDVVFLHGHSKPTLCILYEDDSETRHIKTFVVDNKDKELIKGPWAHSYLDGSAHTLLPVAGAGGVVVVGESTITYYGGSNNNNSVQSTSITPAVMNSFTELTTTVTSSTRYLMGDTTGRLYVLELFRESAGDKAAIFGGASSSSSLASSAAATTGTVIGIAIDVVGRTNVSSSLAYLSDGYLFVGSAFGDSQLVHLSPTPVDAPPLVPSQTPIVPNFVQEKASYQNLGPIMDMCVVAREKEAQQSVLAASGAFGHGSLRMVRSGIGMQPEAELELEGVKGVWSLHAGGPIGDHTPRDSKGRYYHKYVVQAFAAETKALAIDENEMEEAEVAGFDHESTTLHCGNLQHQSGSGSGKNIKGTSSPSFGMMMQVTPQGCYLVDPAASSPSQARCCIFSPSPASAPFIVASSNGSQVVLGQRGGRLTYLTVDYATKAWVIRGTHDLGKDIAALSINPLLSGEGSSSSSSSSSIVAASTWEDQKVHLLALPALAAEPVGADHALQLITSVSLKTDVQARSVLLATLGDMTQTSSSPERGDGEEESSARGNYLLVGFGDGSLHVFPLSSSSSSAAVEVGEARVVALGTKSVHLDPYLSGSQSCAWAGGDKPTVIYRHNGKLSFSVVNSAETSAMVPFSCALFPDCVATAGPAGLLISTPDAVQKLHVMTYPLAGFDPRRVCYHQPSSSAVVTGTLTQMTDGIESAVCLVKFLHTDSMREYHTFHLEPLEEALSASTLLLSMGSGGEQEVVVCVGTVYVAADSTEVDRGRILLFRITSNSFGEEGGHSVTLIGSADVNGPVYNTCACHGRVVAAIDNRVSMFTLSATGASTSKLPAAPSSSSSSDGGAAMPPHAPPSSSSEAGVAANNLSTGGLGASLYSVEEECRLSTNIQVLYVQAYGDCLLLGDLLRSLSLYKFIPPDAEDGEGVGESEKGEKEKGEKKKGGGGGAKSKGSLKEIGRHYSPMPVRGGVAILPGTALSNFEDAFVAADDWGNMFSLGRPIDAETHDDGLRMVTKGEIHLGEYVNCVRRGTLSSQPGGGVGEDKDASVASLVDTTVLMGSTSGSISSLVAISEQDYTFLRALESAIHKNVPPLGQLDYAKYRGFKNDKRSGPKRGVIDGDLIESLLDLESLCLQRADQTSMPELLKSISRDMSLELDSEKGLLMNPLGDGTRDSLTGDGLDDSMLSGERGGGDDGDDATTSNNSNPKEDTTTGSSPGKAAAAASSSSSLGPAYLKYAGASETALGKKQARRHVTAEEVVQTIERMQRMHS